MDFSGITLPSHVGIIINHCKDPHYINTMRNYLIGILTMVYEIITIYLGCCSSPIHPKQMIYGLNNLVGDTSIPQKFNIDTKKWPYPKGDTCFITFQTIILGIQPLVFSGVSSLNSKGLFTG